MMQPNYRAIAREAGVAVNTVRDLFYRRAYKRPPLPRTREAIERAIRKLYGADALVVLPRTQETRPHV